MICPKCSSDTRVIDTRTDESGAQIRRRRVCEGCSHRFTTYESTFDASKRRAAWRKKRAETRAKATPEQVAERRAHRRLMAKVYKEARETGAPINAVCSRWGIDRLPLSVPRP